LKTLDAGFHGDRVLLFTLDSYGTEVTAPERTALYTRLLDRLRALPGVVSVAASRSTPVHTSGNARLLDTPAGAETIADRGAWTNMITPGYFETFGIALLRGRDFNAGDAANARQVAVINETMARFYFGDRDPIGQVFRFYKSPDNPITVVGIARDTYQTSLREPVPRMVYTPLAQEAAPPSRINFEMRTAQDPATLMGAARDAVRGVTRSVVLRYVRTMQQQIDASLVRERLLASLAGGFAVLALVLTAVGLYGVMSYHVSRRGREIGIRMALGARRASVLWQVLRQALVVSIAGIALGIVAALLTTRYLSTLLYGLSARDPLTFAGVAVVLLVTALTAGFFPAHRAATLDPVRAIKAE
jgi:predicted permease